MRIYALFAQLCPLSVYVSASLTVSYFYISCLLFQTISGVGLLSSPIFGDEEQDFVKDVTDFGNILKEIIRNIGDSKNKRKN